MNEDNPFNQIFLTSNQNTVKEQQLILNLKKGSETAYRQVVMIYKEPILKTCLGYVPNLQDAEDLCQEVFIEIFRSIGKFRAEARFSTWIYRIATTKALEFLRYKKRKKRQSFFEALKGLEENQISIRGCTSHHPETQLENKERAKILFAKIEQLSAHQKKAFVLHKIEGRSHKEIAKEMGTTVSAVESLLHRAKKNLRKELEIYYRSGKY